MLRMNKPLQQALLGAALTMAALPAAADTHDHTVYIYEHGFFPEKIYVAWGDKIRYENRSGSGQNMTVPYYFSNYYNQLFEFDFYISNNGSQDVSVYPTGTFDVESPAGDSGHDGQIVFGQAPRQ